MAADRAEEVDGTGVPVGRRVFLGMLGFGLGGVVWGARAASVVARALAPITAADPTGLSSFLPAAGDFRIYSVVGTLPHRDAATYRLKLGGLVDTPLDLGLAELQALGSTRLVKDFQCVTGWRVRDVAWTGVLLSTLLDAAGVQSSAAAVTFTSFDGEYSESLTLPQARRPDVLVAWALRDNPLSDAHGGPVRLYVAPMYGYKSLKWLTSITVVPRVQAGYWEHRGYDVDAFIGKSNGRNDDPVR